MSIISKFCLHCGDTAIPKIPQGDDRERIVCGGCGYIHYENPRVIVGSVPIHEDKVLLCKRAIEPRLGYWTLPAGFLENGETSVEGASRETWEEACAKLEGAELYCLYDLPHINQIYMFYRASLSPVEFSAGAESSDVALFSEEDIPWNDLAFPVINETLKRYFSDRKTEQYPVSIKDIKPMTRTTSR